MSIFSKKINNFGERQYPFVSAVIVAAGNSTRMGGVNKQFLLIDGVPVLIMALRAFDNSDFIDEIIISAREDDIPQMYSMIKDYSILKVKDIVKGGRTRQESVFNAIECCSSASEYVAIHDGARPLVTNDVIDSTVFAAFNYKAAATGTPVKDTIKIIDDEKNVVSTPERNYLWSAQTPQVFERSLYLNAMSSVPGSINFTDDCMLIEQYGHKVKMVDGDYKNIKITTPEDVLTAEILLNGRYENGI